MEAPGSSLSLTDVLLEALEQQQANAFIIAGCIEPAERDLAIEELAAAYQDLQHVVVDLRHTEVKQLGTALQEKLPETYTRPDELASAVIHLNNYEVSLIHAAIEEEEDPVLTLDKEAESLIQTVNGPLIWWVDSYLYERLKKDAPVVWSKSTLIAHPPSAAPDQLRANRPAATVSQEGVQAWIAYGLNLDGNSYHLEAAMAFQQARKLSQEAAYPQGEAAALAGIGQVFQSYLLYDESHEYLDKALDMGGETSDTFDKERTMLMLGRSLAHGEHKDLPEALQKFQEALEGFEARAEWEILGDTLQEMGSIHLQEGKMPAAIAHFQTSIEAYEEVEHHNKAAEMYDFLGRIQEQQGSKNAAIEAYKEAAAAFRKAASPMGEAKAWQHAGSLHQSKMEWMEALPAFEAALKAAQPTQDEFLIAALEDSVEIMQAKQPKKGGKGLFGKLFG